MPLEVWQPFTLLHYLNRGVCEGRDLDMTVCQLSIISLVPKLH